MLRPDLSLKDQVYLTYCEIGNCKHWIETCTDPQKYFANYDTLLDYLQELSTHESHYSFHAPLPHEELRQYKKDYDAYTQRFIFRSWDACLNRAAKRKRATSRSSVLQQFFFQMEPYKSRFSSTALAVLDSLKHESLDLEHLIRKEKAPPVFDIEKERILKQNVEQSSDASGIYFSIMALMDFYYKYRNLSQKYVMYCVKLCEADISLLPKVDFESRQRTHMPFVAHIPAFDRLYQIYARKGDFYAALDICQRHLACPQRGNDPEEERRIKKRMALCQKRIQESRRNIE